MTDSNRPRAAVSHTPGPWRARRDTPNPWWLIEADEHMVADVNRDVMVFNDPLDPTRVEANARLICAAPDLLDALKAARELLSWWQGERGDDIHSAVMERADAAIAKAEGRS